MKHIVQFSGGKDSTAMLLMMLERAEKYLLKEDAWASCCLWEALMQARKALDYVRRVQNG